MKKIFILSIAFFLFFDISYSQMSVNGVNLSAKLKTSTGELQLNGAGVRKKAIFKVYVLGLYLKNPSKDANAILNSKEEKAVKLQITSSMVNSKNMEEAVREGFELSLDGKKAALQSKIDHFIEIFSHEDIKTGDYFILNYVPGVGVKSSKNGKLLATIEGDDFAKALFGIWLGTRPVEAALKTAILGNK
ncbi:MAG: chalcone isomerase family protein [Chitinophagales bacterium]|nr:chalcone isomerase family protein [Chitinophagales bacterium]MCZ2392660.1 chalcone isomerase family protein [Chitinophagales bacterium]